MCCGGTVTTTLTGRSPSRRRQKRADIASARHGLMCACGVPVLPEVNTSAAM